MLFKDVVELITVAYTENELGDQIENESLRLVFANKKSIRQTEFYQAQQTGLKPEIMFDVKTIDYQGEEKLNFEGKQYTVIRAYETKRELTELVCEGLVS